MIATPHKKGSSLSWAGRALSLDLTTDHFLSLVGRSPNHQLIGLLELVSASGQSARFTVFHRLAPLQSAPIAKVPWTIRANLELTFLTTPATVLEVPDDRQITVSSFIPQTTSSSLNFPTHTNATCLYQLSVVPSGSQPPPEEIDFSSSNKISSSPLCALDASGLPNQKVQEYFNIWLRPKPVTAKREPNILVTEGYDLMGINWATSKACTLSTVPSDPQQLHRRVSQSLANQAQWKTRLAVRLPERLPQPVLRPYPIGPAPEILPDGSVKPPPKEQGWFAKYWMYLLPIVVLLILGGGAPEEEGGQGAPAK
ncbi:hypothetical protein CROQUDRAFT_135958 [Cronartium quercuum f. sp. fusiforme G11]|uniref:ER membrane protein complex subunit 10 n=1 Tax=Cronartium quercuum f. sp. fusiforme G11 TaxID=708437 RepID=A0A9P6N8C6_9BASI|nr:hypothetical protein CROQUDRAFT_135958 [Cronartium quercuum f. sp. fusiforme G11]